MKSETEDVFCSGGFNTQKLGGLPFSYAKNAPTYSESTGSALEVENPDDPRNGVGAKGFPDVASWTRRD